MGLFTIKAKIPKKKIESWTRNDVLKWLAHLNLSQYSDDLGDLDGVGLLALTPIDIYTMTTSRQDADTIIQSINALRDGKKGTPVKAAAEKGSEEGGQQPCSLPYDKGQTAPAHADAYQPSVHHEPPEAEEGQSQHLSSVVGGKDVVTQLFEYLEKIGIRGHGLIDATNYSSIVGLLISAMWELHDLAQSAKANKPNCLELVRFSQDILRLMDAEGKALASASASPHLTKLLKALEDAINMVEKCCREGWLRSTIMGEMPSAEDFQSIHNTLLDIMRASRLDTLPNGRQLTHGDYRDLSRPLKRLAKQLGNGSWQEGLKVIAMKDDAAEEAKQLLGVPLEEIRTDANQCLGAGNQIHAERALRGVASHVTEKECIPIFQKYAGPSNVIDTMGWGAFLFDFGVLEDIKPADIDAFLLQHFKNVDAKADGGIDLEEFMVFYEKLNVPLPLRLLREATGAAHESDLKKVFKSFASFGVRQQQQEMDGVRFSKLARDCKLIGIHLTQTDIDIIFASVKAKGSRRISFIQFVDALILMAEKKGQSLADVVFAVLNTHCPAVSATVPEYVRLNDDKTTYTGVYARGGPTNVEPCRDLSAILDRSPADLRGVKKSAHDKSTLRVSLPHSLLHTPVSTPTSGGTHGRSPKLAAHWGSSENKFPTSPAVNAPEEIESFKESDVQSVYEAFAAFGLGSFNRPEKLDMDGAKFAKLCRESRLLCSRFGSTSVDLIFSKVKTKGARKIDFAQFKQALKLIAEEKRVLVEQVEALVVKSGGPRRNGTPTDFVRLHDDKSTFTGVYANGGPSVLDKRLTIEALIDRTNSVRTSMG